MTASTAPELRSELPSRAARVMALPMTATAAAGLAIVLAVVVRTWLVLSRDFPLNDGALFYIMSKEVGDHAFRLPAMTTYNAANIPFAYSPLGFYLTALLHTITGASLMDLLR